MICYAEENERLFAAGDTEELARLNLTLVHSLAGRLAASTGAEYEELFGAGCVGLTKAIGNFDPSRGFAFSTYAVPVIAGEMKRYLRDTGPVKISREIKERAMRIARQTNASIAQTGPSPTVSEIAARLGLGVDEVTEALDAARAPLSLEEEREEELGGAVVGKEDSRLDAESLSLRHALSHLPARDATLIELRYFGGLTQAQTAARLSMTQVQVSRREKKILDALRKLLE